MTLLEMMQERGDETVYPIDRGNLKELLLAVSTGMITPHQAYWDLERARLETLAKWTARDS